MRHKLHPNPDWTAPWNAADLKEFLRQAREYHTAKTQRPEIARNQGLPWDSPYRICPKPRPTSQEVLTWLYKWGRDYRVCGVDFEQFKREVLTGHEYRYGRRRRRFYYSRHDIWDSRPRPPHAHVQPKVLSEQEIARRDWRERKGFSRDQKQRGYHRQCS